MVYTPSSLPKLLDVTSLLREDTSPAIYEDFNWIFKSSPISVELLEGINTAVKMKHGSVARIGIKEGSTVAHVNPYSSRDKHQKAVKGVQNAIDSNFLYMHDNDWVFGRVVNAQCSDPNYEVENELFVPLDWTKRHCKYNDLPSLSNQNLDEWMTNSGYSHFSARMQGINPREASVSNGFEIGGIMFIKSTLEGLMTPENINSKKHEGQDIAVDLCVVEKSKFVDR